ncbi:uncharacterized protein LOC142503765 [Ascaphus truei]|uniref:uncharacterized protein LOC142503765 n=1 Tax=Ascaphus truei TaxID=8439 RepID=UPI003F597B50
MHASGTGGGLPAPALTLTPLEEQMREKFLTVVMEGLPGDRDIGIYEHQFPAVAPAAPVSPVPAQTEHVSSPASSMSSARMDEPDLSAHGQIDSSDHEVVDTPGLTQHSSPPARDTFSAIAASEERILGEENRCHSEMMSMHERMMSLHERMHERTISEMTQIKNVIIQVPKELQNRKITLQALVLNVSQANQFRSTAREHEFHFNPSEDGSLRAANFSPEPSLLHSPHQDVSGTLDVTSVQVLVNIQPLTSSVPNIEPTPTNETCKRKIGQQLQITSFWKKTKIHTQETAPPLLQCISSAEPVPQPTPSAPELPQATPSAPELPQPTPSAPELPEPTPSAPELPQATTSATVKPRVLGTGRRRSQQPTSRPVTRSQKEKHK